MDVQCIFIFYLKNRIFTTEVNLNQLRNEERLCVGNLLFISTGVMFLTAISGVARGGGGGGPPRAALI